MNENVLKDMILLRQTLTTLFDLLHSGSETAVHDVLSCLLDFFKVDRVSIGGFQDNRKGLFTVGQVYTEGRGPVPGGELDYISISGLEWDMEPIFQMNHIAIDDLALYTGTQVDRQRFMQLGVCSIFVFPSIKDEEVIGYAVLETFGRKRVWTDLDIEYAKLFTRLISMTVEKELIAKRLITSAHQLLEHETIFNVIFKNMAWSVEIFDEYGRMIDINDAGLKLFGTTREEILGVSLFDSGNLQEESRALLLKGEVAHADVAYDFGKNAHDRSFVSRYKNEVKYLRVKCVPMKNAKGKVIGYLFLAYDNSKDYLKNQEIKRLFSKMKTAVDTGDSFLMELDIPKNVFTVDFNLTPNPSNKTVARFWEEATFAPEQLDLTLHPEDVQLYNYYLQQLRTGKRSYCSFAFRRIIEGESYWFRASFRTYKWDKQKKAEKIVAYITDITREKEKEIQLFKTREAEKVKSAFMANISHEIRTPLNAIIGFSNILVDMNSTEETEFFRKTINRNNVLLLQLVDDILDFSQIEVGTLKYNKGSVNIKEMCESVLKSYELMLTPEVKLVFNHNASDIFIYADRKRVRQVLSQFVGNAVKYTQAGSITINYDVDDDQMLMLSVSDSGIGIPEKELPMIFNYFYQINNFNQGTGLGLAVAKSMIEGMGGSIGVESEEGAGSVFWFTLPLCTSVSV